MKDTFIGMQPVNTKQIDITDSYLKRAQENTIRYLLSLEPKRFLFEIYKVSGLRPPAKEGYGGWERSDEINFRGHFFGHYLSAMALAYRACQDKGQQDIIKEKLSIAVLGLLEAQQAYAVKHPKSAGYVSAFREVALDMVEGKEVAKEMQENCMVPWYNLHKILAGLLEVATGFPREEVLSRTALQVATDFGLYIYHRMLKVSNKDVMLKTEYGGMNEALCQLYEVTGDEKFLSAAAYFEETHLFDELSKGHDVTVEKHANTMIPKLVGAAKRYLADKNAEERYQRASLNFFDIVTRHHTYVTGGNSQGEHFHEPGKLYYDAEKRNGGCTCETCNTYNMLKLARNLFTMTGEIKYLNYYEHTYINAILASQNPDTGMMTYFQPMGAGYNKIYNRPYDNFWCCSGTGVESFTKLADGFYYQRDNHLLVSQYFSNSLYLPEYDLELHMSFDRKLGKGSIRADKITGQEQKRDKSEKLERLKLSFRLPAYALAASVHTKDRITFCLNGQEQEVINEEGIYTLQSFVKAGDCLEFYFPQTFEAHSTDDNKHYIAFTYGPYVMGALLGDRRMWEDRPEGIQVRTAIKDEETVQHLTVAEDPKRWVENIAARWIWQEQDEYLWAATLTGTKEKLTFVPYYEIHKQRYGIYFPITHDESDK